MLGLKSSLSMFVRLLYFDFFTVITCFLYLMREVYGYQKGNVSNQREHIVNLLANEQSQLRIPEETEPVNL